MRVQSFRLKVYTGSAPEAVEKAIEGRLGLSPQQDWVLVDAEGCDVVVDSYLTTGDYTVVLIPERKKQRSKKKEEKANEKQATKRKKTLEAGLFDADVHSTYFMYHLKSMPMPYTSLDTSRMTVCS